MAELNIDDIMERPTPDEPFFPRTHSLFSQLEVDPDEWSRLVADMASRVDQFLEGTWTERTPGPVQPLTIQTIESRLASLLGPVPGMYVFTITNPLPPLDDLDEGLRCHGQTFPTFAAYMAHRRTHG